MSPNNLQRPHWLRDCVRLAGGARRRTHALPLVGALIAAAASGPASASEIPYVPRTTYGDLGLLEMPSARMAPDGEIAGTLAFLKSSQRYNFAFQLLPWLEGTFRYSRVDRIAGQPVVYDRSFGLKLRLLRESENWPEISVGIRDLLGTGVYSSEYIVASKRISDFDVSAGFGWGRLASVDTFANPFGLLIPSFNTRSSSVGVGGTVDFGRFFHGPSMGLFGGAIWHSPIRNLNLIVEYSSDAYTLERAGGSFKVLSPVNIGVSYRPFDVATVSAGWYYGTSYGLAVTFAADPTIPASPRKLGPEIPEPVIRPVKQQVDALTLLLSRTRPVPAKPGAPFVQVPRSGKDPESLDLVSALMSETTGVHDVDIMGRTLLVDAHFTQLASRQCDRYATLISALAPKLQTVALSDMDDPSGKVAICNIPHTTMLADNDAAPPTQGLEAPAPDADPATVNKKIRADVALQGLGIEALAVEPEMIWLYFTNGRYASETEAAGRIARVLMADAPASAEIFHLVSVRNGVELRDFQISRSALERATLAYGTPAEMQNAVSLNLAPLSNPILEKAWEESYPRYHWSIGPGLREGLFDPKAPLQIQLLAALDASVDLTPRLTIEGRVEANIFNNYDLNDISNSVLPHVRSDFVQYFRKGLNGLANLDMRYRTRLTRDVYLEAKAGYLEDMYAGAGVQVLWRPEGGRFAFGGDVYEVWQRNFDRLFGLRNYRILTGHASIYYESPWYGLNFAVHAGRYLAGDYGATFEVTRRFSTGVEVGAFATFTNVPFDKFGEGSFDKGIIIHIPIEWAMPFYSQSSYDLLLRSLTRDGGARLYDDDSLYAETRPNSYGEVLGHIDDITAP